MKKLLALLACLMLAAACTTAPAPTQTDLKPGADIKPVPVVVPTTEKKVVLKKAAHKKSVKKAPKAKVVEKLGPNEK